MKNNKLNHLLFTLRGATKTIQCSAKMDQNWWFALQMCTAAW